MHGHVASEKIGARKKYKYWGLPAVSVPHALGDAGKKCIRRGTIYIL